MKLHYIHIILGFLLCTVSAKAQLDSIQQLPEVMLTDAKLVHFSKGFKLEKLSDSIVEKNATSLTETLRYNSSIYFKENGFGMVSSPSFRGTNAQQTAVIWNGININSVFTGQTDFNTISPSNYNEISIRSGGGGVQYGSGAVGGSIHLNNSYSFHKTNATEIGLHYGSFTTFGGTLGTTQAWDTNYLNVKLDFVSSDNNYDFIGKNQKNQHGQFLRLASNVTAAKELKNGVATWNSEYTYNDRNFSGSLNTIGKDGYKDVATRNLWQLQQNMGAFTTKASVAHLFEHYRYYPNSEKPLFDEGRANTLISMLQSEVFLRKKFRLLAKIQYTVIDAEGDNVGQNTRNTLAAVLLLNHKIGRDFSYGLNFRKEFLNNFENPLLFSADANWQLSNTYALRVNGSKNYRVPTFNDLFWYAGGNNQLQPETSYQIELGQEFNFGKLKTDLAAFYISSTDLIKWVPASGNVWEPINISKTRNYGLEFTASYFLKFGKLHALDLNAQYSYTKAEDLEKEKQLIYVPFHKASGTAEYSYKNLSAYIQGLFNGEVFTTTDNSEGLDSFNIYNLGITYLLQENPTISIGARVKNIFNTYYENVAFRPMPSRNFQIFLTINI
ncbi:TonB-dependent receptor [Aequorivita flava]|uniref:TonB-dependent receptor n=1 Tax=Aequorivita flava TaxID=3114371 RepID=A0AB35YUI5_9FLAO